MSDDQQKAISVTHKEMAEWENEVEKSRSNGSNDPKWRWYYQWLCQEAIPPLIATIRQMEEALEITGYVKKIKEMEAENAKLREQIDEYANRLQAAEETIRTLEEPSPGEKMLNKPFDQATLKHLKTMGVRFVSCPVEEEEEERHECINCDTPIEPEDLTSDCLCRECVIKERQIAKRREEK